MPIPFVRDNRTTLKIPIRAPLDEVWELLATPAGLSRWLSLACEGDIGPDSTFRMAWSKEPRAETSTHRVTIWQPPQRFGFTWPAVQLSFDLGRQEGMTVVKLSCTYTAKEASTELQIEELVGWTMHLLTLKSIAEGGPDLRTPGDTFAWDKGYITGF